MSLALLAVRGPQVLVQAGVLKREVPRLPDAARPWRGAELGPDPIRLLVLGDSTAAGVGVDSQDEALPGHLARALRRHTDRGVSWRAVGRNGATTRDIVTDYLDEAVSEPADLIFLSIGANDAIHARTTLVFRRDLRRILSGLSAAMPDALIVLCRPCRFSGCSRSSPNRCVRRSSAIHATLNVSPVRSSPATRAG